VNAGCAQAASILFVLARTIVGRVFPPFFVAKKLAKPGKNERRRNELASVALRS
jgi:hypothetical protein